MELSKQDIENLKAEHGQNLTVLEAEPNLKAVFKDPFGSISTAKLLFTAIAKSEQEFAEAYINNLFLVGDPEFKTDPSIATGLAEEIKDLLDMPEHSFTKTKTGYELESEGEKVEIRTITREDLVNSARKDKTKEPFNQPTILLSMVAKGDAWRQLMVNNTRAFIGILVALDEVKEKKTVTVKKL